MAIVYALPITISSLLIGAHFLRAGLLPLTVICMLMPALLVMKKRWVPMAMKIFLLLACAEWLRTLLAFVAIYKAHGMPYTRLTIFFIAVILFTLSSMLVLKTGSMRSRYRAVHDQRPTRC